MKKLTLLFLCILCLLSLSSCGYSEAKKEAREKVKKYKAAFEQAVKDAYGEDAKLTNVKSSVDANTNGIDFSTTFYSTGLEGTIKLNGESYKAFYDEINDKIIDNVHSDIITNELMSSLPFDDSKYIKATISELYLDPSIDSYDEYVESQYACLDIRITTTEDLSSYKNIDIEAIPAMKKVEESETGGDISIKIVSLNSKSKSDSVHAHFSELYFDGDSHPTVQDNSGTKDAFVVYDINNAIEVVYPGEFIDGSHLAYMD